jgi:60 kDa SS-A/Ro ribonucleoprotein
VTDPLTQVRYGQTPQHTAADPQQTLNHAGGYAFTVTPMARLNRFLTIGTTGGTYYVAEQDLTRDAATVVFDMLASDGMQVIAEVIRVSVEGLAPKQDPCLFTLAAATIIPVDPGVRLAAFQAVPLVCRTFTHLTQFVRYREQLDGGWGRMMRRAVAAWYEDKPVEDVAYQMVKYRTRNGYTHRDLLRLAHPHTNDVGRAALFDCATGRNVPATDLPGVMQVFARLQSTPVRDLPAVLTRGETRGATWEMLPPEALTSPDVWRVLVDNGMPMTALTRWLPTLTRVGVLGPMNTGHTPRVVDQLTQQDNLTRARVHPISLLIARATYMAGRSARGSNEWTPVAEIGVALETAFHLAWRNVRPTGKRTMLALDVSASMADKTVGDTMMTPRELSAAMALVTAQVEPNVMLTGFTSGRGGAGHAYGDSVLSVLPIPRGLQEAVATVSGLPFGGTDCALPMVTALEQGWEVDTFVIWTDSETWYGDIHPHEALRRYRAKTGIPARLAVVALTGTDVTIADPSDPGMLDVSGFSADTPGVIAGFSEGRF